MTPLAPAARPRPALDALLGAGLATLLTIGLVRASDAGLAPAAVAPEPALAGAPAPDLGTAREARGAVDLLWPALEVRRFARADWEHRAALLASALDPRHRHELARLVGDGSASSLRRVAAAELLRRVALDVAAPEAAGKGLPPALHRLRAEDLAFLRGAAHNGLSDAGLACAARRALVDLGDWSDRLRLARELALEPDREARLALAWCLRAVRDHGLLADLAALLVPADGESWPASAATATRGAEPHRGPGAEVAELAAAALGTLLAATPPPPAELRAALLEELLGALDAPFCPPALQERLVAALATLGGPEARGRLERLTREGEPAAARALARLADGRRALERLLSDPRAGEAARLQAATALAFEPASAPPERAAGRAALARLAAGAMTPDHRARASVSPGN